MLTIFCNRDAIISSQWWHIKPAEANLVAQKVFPTPDIPIKPILISYPCSYWVCYAMMLAAQLDFAIEGIDFSQNDLATVGRFNNEIVLTSRFRE